ncbi:MAG: hypothetical protein WBD18_07480, partial [Phycisphaerae bacterium]
MTKPSDWRPWAYSLQWSAMPEADRQSVYRILDANANRAREALRVAEEAARFALERADLAEALKRLRHDLRAALG